MEIRLENTQHSLCSYLKINLGYSSPLNMTYLRFTWCNEYCPGIDISVADLVLV